MRFRVPTIRAVLVLVPLLAAVGVVLAPGEAQAGPILNGDFATNGGAG